MSMLVAFGHSDSIGYGAADNQSNAYGFGIFMRALIGTGVPSQFRAGFSACVSSTTQANYNSQSRIRYWEKYADIVYDNEGTNDLQVNGNLITAAAMLTLKRTGWTNSKTINPSVKLISSLLGCRTASTDSWVTEANQTPNAPGWAAGGDVETYNTSLAGEVGTNINALATRNFERGILGNTKVWKASMTTDGLHPNGDVPNAQTGLELMALMKSFDPPTGGFGTIKSGIGIGIGI